jgi:O-antigen/teichoic acid export membrane protein
MALNIILNILLIPKYGAIGASIATSIAYTPYVILNWLEVRKILNK